MADIGRFFEVTQERKYRELQEAIEYTKAAERALGHDGAQEQADEWGASEKGPEQVFPKCPDPGGDTHGR